MQYVFKLNFQSTLQPVLLYFISMYIQGGGYMLILKPNQYDILTNIGAFRGLKVSYDIAPGGLYHIRLNSADWSTFQVNLGATGSVKHIYLYFICQF